MEFFLLMLLIIIVILCVRYIKDIRFYSNKVDNINRKSSIFQSSFGKVQYQIVGNGIPVVILHGITGGIDQCIGLKELYFTDRYKFIYISRFGYLRSDIPNLPTVTKQAFAIKELLDSLNEDTFIFFGNSAGGTVSLEIVNKFPEVCRGLILLSSNLPGEIGKTPPLGIMRVVAGNNFLYWLLINAFGKFMISSFLDKDNINSISRSEIKILKQDILFSALPITSRKEGFLFDMFYSNPYINSEDFDLKESSIPLLIIHGSDDPGIPLENTNSILKMFSNSRLKVFSGGHLLYGNEKGIKKSIDEFIN